MVDESREQFDKLSILLYYGVFFRNVLNNNKKAMDAIKTLNEEMRKDSTFSKILSNEL